MASVSAPARPLMLIPHCNYAYEDRPPPPRRSREFDPHNPPLKPTPDPRAALPCRATTCCACRPGPLRKKPFVANLKFKQLADCYNCRVSETCHNKRKTFYQRWQTYLDRFPRRFPNTDYAIYSCNDYVDLGVNDDFNKYDKHLLLRPGPRTEALKNFLWMKNLAQANYEYKMDILKCPVPEPFLMYQPPIRFEAAGPKMIKQHNLYNDDAVTFWRDRRNRPEYKNFVEGGTPSNNYNRPFKKDLSFSHPLDNLSSFASGNDAPYKQFRDLKMM